MCLTIYGYVIFYGQSNQYQVSRSSEKKISQLTQLIKQK